MLDAPTGMSSDIWHHVQESVSQTTKASWIRRLSLKSVAYWGVRFDNEFVFSQKSWLLTTVSLITHCLAMRSVFSGNSDSDAEAAFWRSTYVTSCTTLWSWTWSVFVLWNCMWHRGSFQTPECSACFSSVCRVCNGTPAVEEGDVKSKNIYKVKCTGLGIMIHAELVQVCLGIF